ncbi:hypothetical protein FQR65_LT15083 [Abscondita terminalis]|nr:hypothetical protein FQR65_LT15083 [Abscondita terminalis]
MNRYGLNKQLVKLELKNYKVIQEEKEDWPAELLQNRCSVARAKLLDDSSMFRNRVIVKFSDCNDKVLLESKGMSMQKEYETGFFADALGNFSGIAMERLVYRKLIWDQGSLFWQAEAALLHMQYLPKQANKAFYASEDGKTELQL